MGLKFVRNKKPKREFSKMHVAFADALVFFVFLGNWILSYLDKTPISDVAIAIITTYGVFATGGYFALCGVRNTSLNKIERCKIEHENREDSDE